MIPSFLLAKMYVKGSLKNTANGFEFALKNIVDSAVLVGIGPISVGEKNYEGDAITLTVAERVVSGTALSRSNPVPVRMGVLFKVAVIGEPLPAGVQHISVSATTGEIGRIKFDITETLD